MQYIKEMQEKMSKNLHPLEMQIKNKVKMLKKPFLIKKIKPKSYSKKRS